MAKDSPKKPANSSNRRTGSRHVAYKMVAHLPEELRKRLRAYIDSDQHDIPPKQADAVRLFLDEALSKRGF